MTTTETEFKIDTRPIKGDIQSRPRGTNVPQKSAAEFIAAIDAVLAFPEIDSIRWDQYTPYFNDGEPCEFGSYEPRFRLTGTDEDSENGDYEDGYDTTLYRYGKHTTWEDRPERPSGGYGQRYDHPDVRAFNDAHSAWSKKYYADDNKISLIEGERSEAVLVATDALAKAWSSFEYVLQDNFGDPAQVTATREGFEVEYYEHD